MERKIRKAFVYRKNIGIADNATTNVYRLLYAEGDGLPGLIVDFYNGVAVLQAHSIGMHVQRIEIAKALKEVMGDQLKAVYDKSSEALYRNKEGAGLEIPNSYILGEPQGIGEVIENGNRFYVDWENGQKQVFLWTNEITVRLWQSMQKTNQYVIHFVIQEDFQFTLH